MSERTRATILRSTPVRGALGALALAVAFAATPPGQAEAQAREDGRWLPWLGCWEAVDQDASGGMLCIRPAGSGVEMLTVADGEVVSAETLTADGRPQAMEREGCVGTQSARFSADDRRLFLASEHTCGGEFSRSATGLMAMTSPSTWVDVQVVDAGGRDMAWVRHYRPAPAAQVERAGFASITEGRGLALRTARYDAVASIDVEDVVEASRSVDPAAVRAWVAEQQEPFDLNADRLVALADAGVDPEVIDVMIAVSYPERFALDDESDRADRYEDEYGPYGRDGYGRYGRYGYRGGYYYDPFYSPWGYGYGGYYGYRPRVIVVTPVDGSGADRGRMIKGRGYTRQPRGSSDSGGGSAPSTSRSGTSRSGGAATSGSAGSTRSSTGRTAKPRGGGSGGGGEREGGGSSLL